MSLGNPLDPCIQNYENIIKEEFSVVEDLFNPSFSEETSSSVAETRQDKLSWLKDEEVVPEAVTSVVPIPALEDLMEDSSPDVIVPDLFQDLADLNSSSSIFEDLESSPEELSDFLGGIPSLEETDEEGLRSDIMWSSACLNEDNPMASANTSSLSSKRPRRDSTLSLMECAQNLFREFELSGFPFLDTPLPSSEDDDEEEIDVVSFEQQWVSHKGVHHHHHHKHPKHHHHLKAPTGSSSSSSNSVNNLRVPPIRSNAGRSLLKSQQNPPVLDHGWGDHIYHSVAQPAPMGILTPTESEDDEEQSASKNHSPTIVKAVQSLIKAKPANANNCNSNANASSSKDNVKFKFRMKFKSNSSNSTTSASSQSLSESSQSLLRSSCKRKSASNNTYCPPPSSPIKSSPSSRVLQESKSKKGSSGLSSSSSQCSGSNRHSVSEAKCREVRDLHNSMERQRRVDLRNNFDQLKVVVPELKDAEKASKLNILNKSAEYCKYLTSTDIRLRKEKEQLLSRNAALTQRLSQLKSLVDRRYHQQRLSEKRSNTLGNNYGNNTHVLLPQPIRTLA